MSIYEKQRMEIKEQILDAAINLFKTKGYDKTSITEITKEVGIAKGTFYNYFDSKKAILFIWAEDAVKKLDMSKFFNNSNSVKENIHAFIETISYTIVENQNLYLRCLKEIHLIESNIENKDTFDFKPLYLNIFKASKDFESIENKHLKTKIGVLNNSLFMGIIDFFNNQSDKTSLESYLKEIADICLYGIYTR